MKLVILPFYKSIVHIYDIPNNLGGLTIDDYIQFKLNIDPNMVLWYVFNSN